MRQPTPETRTYALSIQQSGLEAVCRERGYGGQKSPEEGASYVRVFDH